MRYKNCSSSMALIYVMAVWALAKIIIAVKNLIQRRKEDEPILAAACTLSFAAALILPVP